MKQMSLKTILKNYEKKEAVHQVMEKREKIRMQIFYRIYHHA